MSKVERYWLDFLKTQNINKDVSFAGELSFEDTDEQSIGELTLILCGKKRAFTSALESFKLNNEKLPQKNAFSVLTDWNGEPKGIIQTTNVTILPFEDVTWEMAQKEGEDTNLEEYRQRYADFFEYDSSIMGYDFKPSMLVVFEEFGFCVWD
ncbi:MAG: ASCH domain-containing protein [Treponema sp.]|jgi:uncharacterized protein YhfF|nr:ASCH domain-containing protein [Treponema sp.]